MDRGSEFECEFRASEFAYGVIVDKLRIQIISEIVHSSPWHETSLPQPRCRDSEAQAVGKGRLLGKLGKQMNNERLRSRPLMMGRLGSSMTRRRRMRRMRLA